MANKYGNNARALYGDIADAIRTVGKTTEAIRAYDFPQAIRDIKTCELTLTVTGLPGALATAVSESGASVSATIGDSGIVVMELPEQGIYTVSATLNGDTAISRVVTATGEYETEMLFPDPILNNNTPKTIQIAAKRGVAANIWNVGDKIGIYINGTVASMMLDGTYYAVILGFNHNSNIEGGDSIHFQFGKNANGKNIAFVDYYYDGHSSLPSFRMNTSQTCSGGWGGSYMRKNVCVDFLNALPSEWRDIIVACNKYSDNTGDGKNTTSSVTSTLDKIWLLSEFEVFGITSGANVAEQNYQRQYDYYKNGNSKIKYRHDDTGKECIWWLRSTEAESTSAFRIVFLSGSNGNRFSNVSYGFAPGFMVA